MTIDKKFTQAVIIKLIKGKTNAAPEAFYDQYAQVLWLAISRRIPEKENAEMVFEQTFVRIWNSIDLYNEQDKTLLAWMMAIAIGLVN
jgi:DNA-directed RNA polymerase specialized sigma24 family protein